MDTTDSVWLSRGFIRTKNIIPQPYLVQLIEIEDEVILYITGQNDPCSVLNVYHELALKSFINKRGVIATIMKAGTVKPGDTYRIIKGNS